MNSAERDVKFNIIQLNVSPVYEYTSYKWIKNKRCEKGGYNRKVVIKYNTPKIVFNLIAEVDIEMCIGDIYMDLKQNRYRAMSKTKVANFSEIINFEIPAILICIASFDIDGSKRQYPLTEKDCLKKD